MSKDLSSVASTLRDVTVETAPELKATIQRVRVVADNLASTSSRIDTIMAENQGDIRAFTQAGLPELERVARESRAAAAEIQDLVRSLRDNPSRLIYQPRDGGVEIPR
jgi:phospholipid/cholesterol/gamma-HCH transport system substrate-binding protein